MHRRRSLDQLGQILLGQSPEDVSWEQIIEIANRSLVTPRLKPVLDRVAIPADVKDFVDDVFRRNQLRNERLYVQLQDAALALNRVGLAPLVLKGAACLVRSGGDYARMISDIDLVIDATHSEAALPALQEAGFVMMALDAQGRHAMAVLARSQDPGQLDVQHRPPGPAIFFHDVDLKSHSALRQLGRSEVWLPDPHLHIYLQSLHDQLHDGGYWHGGLDLRHAWDIADLIKGPEPVDWEKLARLSPTRLTAQAVAVQLEACHLLTGAIYPAAMRSWSVRFQARRQRLQFIVPQLRIPLALAAIVMEAPRLVQHRRAIRRSRAEVAQYPERDDLGRSLKRLIRILTVDVSGRL